MDINNVAALGQYIYPNCSDLPAALHLPSSSSSSLSGNPSRYEKQKRRDWNTFCEYVHRRPPNQYDHNPSSYNYNYNNNIIACSSTTGGTSCHHHHHHIVLEFLRYLDQFGKTKIHNQTCVFFGDPSPPAPCPCPLRQAWGSLDALVGRLRAAYEEHGGKAEANPFGARTVRLFLREVRSFQAKSRGITYDKKKRKRSSCKLIN